MRIVQLITRMDVLGGAQTHVMDLTKGLIEKDHDVIVISYGTSALTEQLQQLNIRYIEIPSLTVPIHPFKDFRAFIHLKKILQQVNPDLLAIHSSKVGIIGRLAGAYLKIPTVFTAHSWAFSGIESSWKKQIFIKIERFVGLLSKGIITVSQYNLEEAIQYKIARKVDKTMIHNGIVDNITSTNRTRNKDSPIHLVMVARFASPKNHRLLLDALKQVSHRSWKLTLVGGGPLLQDIQLYAKTCQLDKQITFTGESTDVEAILQSADVFLLISTSEGLPISIIEAMRASLPTIASHVGGVNELIDDSSTGFLVDKTDITQLTKRLELIINDDNLRRKLGINARNKFLQQFALEQMVDKTEHYYKQVLFQHQTNKQEVLQR